MSTPLLHRFFARLPPAVLLPILFCLAGCGCSGPHSFDEATSSDVIEGDIRLLFVGDWSFGENYQASLGRNGAENILESRGYDDCVQGLAPLLRRATWTLANLETPLTTMRRSPLQDRKRYIHWGDMTKTPRALHRYGVTAVSLANNHSMDYGAPGLAHTIEALDAAGIEWLGAGRSDEEARLPLLLEFPIAGGTFRVAVAAGFEHRSSYEDEYDFYAREDHSGVNGWSLEVVARQVRSIRERDPDAYVIAYPHWGGTYAGRSVNQKKMAHRMIDAGADLVLGHGAHIFQEIEQYRGKWIIYGLGNFIFNSPGRYEAKGAAPYSLAAFLEVTSAESGVRILLRLYPLFSDNLRSDYRPFLVNGEQFTEIQQIVLENGPSRREIARHIRTAEDDRGRFFVLDVTP